MSIRISPKQKQTISAIIPEALLESEELAHLTHELKFIDEEVEQPAQDTWVFSFASLMTVLACMFVLVYSLQNKQLSSDGDDNTEVGESVDSDIHQKVIVENQNLQGDLNIAKALNEELQTTRTKLENEVKTKSLKIDELESEIKTLKSKR